MSDTNQRALSYSPSELSPRSEQEEDSVLYQTESERNSNEGNRSLPLCLPSCEPNTSCSSSSYNSDDDHLLPLSPRPAVRRGGETPPRGGNSPHSALQQQEEDHHPYAWDTGPYDLVELKILMKYHTQARDTIQHCRQFSRLNTCSVKDRLHALVQGQHSRYSTPHPVNK